MQGISSVSERWLILIRITYIYEQGGDNIIDEFIAITFDIVILDYFRTIS